jgi:hypothetical protein
VNPMVTIMSLAHRTAGHGGWGTPG